MNPYTHLPRVPILAGRQALILDRCQGKKVLRLGCVDADLVQTRFERGELMHQKLNQVADQLWGIDIDVAGISFLQDQGFANLQVGDICKMEGLSVLQQQAFEVIVASEVVEHLQNPGLFLSRARELMAPDRTELIITVPNAFRIDTLLWLLRGVELVHPDHNYWFSYVTASNLVRKSGLTITELYVYTLQPSGLLPRRGRPAHSSSGPTGPCAAGHRDHTDFTLLRRVPAYLKSVPKRLLAAFLYGRTPFWGDGLILVTKVAANDA